MGTRLSLAQMSHEDGFDDLIEFLEEYADMPGVPACCSDGCMVEPDGRCEHGHPSIFIAAGVI